MGYTALFRVFIAQNKFCKNTTNCSTSLSAQRVAHWTIHIRCQQPELGDDVNSIGMPRKLAQLGLVFNFWIYLFSTENCVMPLRLHVRTPFAS